MPKQKTRKSVAKRFKKTGNGKYKYSRAGNRHIQQKKNAKRRRRLKKAGIADSSDLKRIKSSLPYG